LEVRLIRKDKEGKVEDLKNIFKNTDSIIFTDHSGLKSESTYSIRTKLADLDSTLKIIKNTLALRAVKQIYDDVDFERMLKGPTSMVVCGAEPAVVAKLIKSFMREFETFKIKGGLFDGRIYEAAGVERLATLPSKEVLISQLLGLFNNPMGSLVNVLSAVPRNLAMVLDAVRQQKEQSGSVN
jgi:large subunit ribosomal protein L10